MEKKESRELSYKLAVKLLDLMLKNGFLLPEEYEKIDALNRLTFKPELSKVYAESTRYPAEIVVLCGANRRGNFKEGISEDGGALLFFLWRFRVENTNRIAESPVQILFYCLCISFFD